MNFINLVIPCSLSYPLTTEYATVRNVDMSRLIGDNGVLHTKFWIVDSRHTYIGSANMDWKSFTEVKQNCFGALTDDFS